MTPCARPDPRTPLANSPAARTLDRLARAVASLSSRRGALIALLRSLLVPLLSSRTARAQECDVCSGLLCTESGCLCDPTACANLGGCCDGDSCCDAEECCFGLGNLPACYHVHCPPGLAFCLRTTGDRCRSGCVNLNRDPRHCGRCGHQCRYHHRCRSGRCREKRASHHRHGNAREFTGSANWPPPVADCFAGCEK